jgi:membrane-bound lytic murein transglycosylase D
MKKSISFLIIYLTAYSMQAQVQLSLPEAPEKVEFANVMVELNSDARKNVDIEISKLLTPPNKFLDQKLERIQWYFPIIEKILEEENVPEDFKYIAVLESSLLPEAISSSNAVGFWQFKEATARELGSRIDNTLDDRKNIYFSTRAAALYMKKNNLVFKNWVSCMLTYNQGLTGASANIPVEWSYASEIKFDGKTHPYLIKALAHRIAYEHRLNRLKNSPKKFIEYPTKGKSFAEIAIEMSLDINELRKYNAWLYGATIPEDRDYNILVLSRIEDADEIGSKINKRTNYKNADIGYPQLKRVTMVSTSPESPIFYTINGKRGILAQPGQETAQLATKSKTKIGKFLKYNDMSDRGIVKEGNVYYLQTKNKKAKVPFHTITGTQTLYDVSQMYGVQLKCLYKYNRMKPTQDAQLGRVIWMQKARPKNKSVEIIQEVIRDSEQQPIKDETTINDTSTPNKETEGDKFKEVDTAPNAEEKTSPINNDGLKTDDPIFKPKPTPIKPKVEEVIAAEKPVKVIKPTLNTKKTHLVQQGETLFSISKKYDLTVDQLRKLNNLKTTETIKNNQLLIVKNQGTEEIETTPAVVTKKPVVKVPVETLPEEEPVSKPVLKNNAKLIHTVTSGETLFSLAKKYNVSVNDLQNWNNLNDNAIQFGQKLIVGKGLNAEPKSSSIVEPNTAAYRFHKVLSGETLYSISRKYGVTVAEIKKWNSLSDNNVPLGSNIKIRK